MILEQKQSKFINSSFNYQHKLIFVNTNVHANNRTSIAPLKVVNHILRIFFNFQPKQICITYFVIFVKELNFKTCLSLNFDMSTMTDFQVKANSHAELSFRSLQSLSILLGRGDHRLEILIKSVHHI